MNDNPLSRKIARIFFVTCWICLVPAVYGYIFVAPDLLKISRDSWISWGITALFALGLALMWGYFRLMRGRIIWLDEGWIWGLTFLGNLFPLVLASLQSPGLVYYYMNSMWREWPMTLTDGVWRSFEIFLTIWWPVAVILSLVAFGARLMKHKR